jgi:flagellar basal-body rod protein FlgB
MINNIEQSLKFQGEALKLRAARQSVIASNMANADTPQYKAVDFDFNRALGDALKARSGSGAGSGTNRSAGAGNAAQPRIEERVGAEAGADGNTVNMDTERAAFMDNAVRYEATLRFINGKLKTMLSAIQGQ